MSKKLLVILIVLISYLVYARFVLIPHDYINFSLIDDGQSIKNGKFFGECVFKFRCENFKIQIKEQATGTSRIFYWTFQSILYQNPFINAQFQHLLRIYFFGSLMVVLLSSLALSAKANPLAVILGAAIFITNYSYSENIIRLGPAEPYQVILLALFSLVYLNAEAIKKRSGYLYFLSAIALLILLFFAKETSIVVLPVLLVMWIIFPKKNKIKDILLILLLPTVLYFLIGKPFSDVQDVSKYASNYNFNLNFIIQNAKYFITATMVSTSPFLKILLFLLVVPLIYQKFRKKIFTRNLLYWLLLFTFFTAVYFPWKYVLDRYLITSLFCFSLAISILIGVYIDIFKDLVDIKKHKAAFYLGCTVLMVGLFLRSAPVNFVRTINYRNWFTTFTQFEGEQVREIAKYANVNTVYLNAKDNIDNMEVLYEIPLHLRYFYSGENQTIRLGDNIPTKGYLFSRSSLDPVIPLDKISKYQLISSQDYSVRQIDQFAFKAAFNNNPVKAIQNIPYSNNITYYWEIRKLK